MPLLLAASKRTSTTKFFHAFETVLLMLELALP